MQVLQAASPGIVIPMPLYANDFGAFTVSTKTTALNSNQHVRQYSTYGTEQRLILRVEGAEHFLQFPLHTGFGGDLGMRVCLRHWR